MKKAFSLLISPRTTLVLLLVFAIGAGAATFIEDKYDTTTAQLVVYRAWWFELVIALMALNFIANIKRYNLWSRQRLGGLLFHLGFVVMILGAATTRYFGFEGSMHIREGESTDIMQSSEPYLQVRVTDPVGQDSLIRKVHINQMRKNRFNYSIKTSTGKAVTVKFNSYLRNAEETVNENVPGGQDMIALRISAESFNHGVYLKKGEKINTGSGIISFGDSTAGADILIEKEGSQLFATSDGEISSWIMNSSVIDSVAPGNKVSFTEGRAYQQNKILFSLLGSYQKADLGFRETVDDGHNHGVGVMVLDVSYDGQTQKVYIADNASQLGLGQMVSFGNLKLGVKYGPRELRVPFRLHLNKFILERYAGSKSPSSYASEVTVMSTDKKKLFDKRIYMNHVLDYKGYRFFQSSYDQDEKGTILSVNHDFWGTWISYLSYLMLLVGFVITLLSRHTRYHLLTVAIKNIREHRKSLMILAVLAVPLLSQAQHNEHVVDQKEVEKLGRIIVQTFDGRLQPLHTLAYDALHKIAKKDKVNFTGKGPMDPMMVMFDMLADPEYWKKQKMIFVREKSVRQVIGITGKYAAFNDFINSKGEYKLSQLAQEAFQKAPVHQNVFDKELIRVDERVNLFYMLLQGSMMHIFPVSNDSRKWVAWNDSLSFVELTGPISVLNSELQLKPFTYNSLLQAYLKAAVTGSHTGNYGPADKILGYIRDIQRNNVLASDFPSETKIGAELWYNKTNIFKKLKSYYTLLGLLLTALILAGSARSEKRNWYKWTKRLFIGLMMAAFLFHTLGMALRWYITNHAPWSNGYEALLLVAWSVLLAGFFSVRNSRIIMAATAVLAGIILMTAGHSYYDPQLTNLQPVLQSYWLIIHVASITISYGFLALGFFLGVINMFLYLFGSTKRNSRSDQLIHELTYINEKNLQVGLFLATLGTFLGGVWANESWGRYWGWDAKETWALIIIIVYSIVLHLRLVPRFQGTYSMNAGSIIGFGSVLMTFVGVNYYFSKGLHSYASDNKTAFPMWGWVIILSLIGLMIAAKMRLRNAKMGQNNGQVKRH